MTKLQNCSSGCFQTAIEKKNHYIIYIYLMTTWFLAVHIISYPFMQNESGQKKFCTEADVSEQEVLALGLKTLGET